MLFQTKKPAYERLRKKWTGRHKALQDNLWTKHTESFNWLTRNIPARQLAVGGLGGLMLLSTPAVGVIPTTNIIHANEEIVAQKDNNRELGQKLANIVPKEDRKLTTEEDQQLSALLTEQFGFKVTSELQGIRLNRTYGVIGGEQHLYRFPGDNVYKHADNISDWAMYGDAGVAPGLGAWGYFAQSEDKMTEQDRLRERYYIAVQTFLAPGFSERTVQYRDFFKYRKMLVVNTITGQSVVTDIADAGPSEFTGKHLGGSPEVMHFLGLGGGPRKGPVLYYFIEDPSIPLGPVKVKEVVK